MDALEDLYLHEKYGDPDARGAMTTAAAAHYLHRNNLTYHLKNNAVEVLVEGWKQTATPCTAACARGRRSEMP